MVQEKAGTNKGTKTKIHGELTQLKEKGWGRRTGGKLSIRGKKNLKCSCWRGKNYTAKSRLKRKRGGLNKKPRLSSPGLSLPLQKG